MSNPHRIGAAVVALSALAACSGYQTPTATTGHLKYEETARYNAIYGSQVVEPRPFRSKCDDLTDSAQRYECYQTEKDDLSNKTDYSPNG